MLTGILCVSIAMLVIGVVAWLLARARRGQAPEVHLLWIPLGAFVYALTVWAWASHFS